MNDCDCTTVECIILEIICDIYGCSAQDEHILLAQPLIIFILYQIHKSIGLILLLNVFNYQQKDIPNEF